MSCHRRLPFYNTCQIEAQVKLKEFIYSDMTVSARISDISTLVLLWGEHLTASQNLHFLLSSNPPLPEGKRASSLTPQHVMMESDGTVSDVDSVFTLPLTRLLSQFCRASVCAGHHP